jgi:hypothetical protein
VLLLLVSFLTRIFPLSFGLSPLLLKSLENLLFLEDKIGDEDGERVNGKEKTETISL